MTDPAARLDPLFRGAARLGLLLGGLELPWQQVAPVVARFPAELRDELELAVAQAGPPLWLRTRGEGQGMTHRVARFMEERGVAEARLRRLLVTAGHWGHQHLLFELGVDRTGPAAFAWLVRQPVTLDEARAWLAAEGAGTELLARLGLVAQALEKAQVHAVGEQLDGADCTQLVALSSPADGQSWPRLALAARRAGLDAAAWAPAEALMPRLAERDTRLVLELRDGALRGLRLDLDGVPAQVLADGGSYGERVAMLAELSGGPALHRATLRLGVDGTASWTAWTTIAAE